MPAHVPKATSNPAALVVATVCVAYLTLGFLAQALNLAYGIWFTEMIIFLGLPWVMLTVRAPRERESLGLASPGPGGLGLAFALGAANFFAFIVPLQSLALWIAPEPLKRLADASGLFRDRPALELSLILLGVCVAAPIGEEFFFRGVLQRGLMKHLSRSRAVLLASIVFSALHMDPVGFAARLQLGVLFGLLYATTGSIWPGVMAHAANNTVSAFLFFVSRDAGATGGPPEGAQPTLVQIATITVLGLSVMGSLGFLAYRRRDLLAVPTPRALDDAPRSPWVLAAPWLGALVAGTALVLTLDWRGVALNLFDLRHPLPSERASPLKELRSEARSGNRPLSDYFTERAGLSRELTRGSDSAPPAAQGRPSQR